MPTLAIKGNNKRCEEVIKVLEMLGGKNKYNLTGDETHAYYVIEYNEIKCGSIIFGYEPYVFFSLEEFLKQNPYAIGDRVVIPEYESEVRICKMHWDGYEVQYMVYRCDEEEYYSAKELTEYNEINDVITEDNNLYDKLDFTQEPSADKVELILGDYEIKEENGKTYLVKKQQENKCITEYPASYEECCDILELSYISYCVGYKEDLLDDFQKLLICRDAYWKLAGEEIGLGKPWKPDWNDEKQFKYGLYSIRGGIMKDGSCINSTLFAFHAEEIRDNFYKNFKNKLENCKNLFSYGDY